jgi:hypothetical protein
MHLRRCTTDETVMRHDERNETLSRCYAMSWEDVRARFPYGLPASLQQGEWFHSAKVIDLEKWRRHRQGTSSRWGRRGSADRFEP